MRVLLDTHALVWMLDANPRLSTRAAVVIDDPATDLLVSAVSGYEIGLKNTAGKFPEATSLAAAFERQIARAGCRSLPVTLAHAVAAGKLDLAHRDPFDRLLAAQALVEGVPLVSNDEAFDRFGIDRVW